MKIERKDLLWGVGLLLTAVSIVFLWVAILTPLARWAPIWVFETCGRVLQACSFVAIGAGIGAPFKKKMTGAFVCVTVFLLLLMLTHLPSRIR